MGAVQSNPFDQSPPYKSIVECRVEATSSDKASKIWFSTPPVTQALLDRFETLQLTTVSHNELPEELSSEPENSWFELVIYRSWDRSRPRLNLATKKELSWRSHCSPPCESEAGTEVKGTLFGRGDEILKEIEEGDVIAVRVCARYPAWVNYAIRGTLEVGFRGDTLALVPTTYTVYPYSSLGPCYVLSQDHTVSSKIWFTTPRLKQNTIDKLHEIQLFTESRDQGWADDCSGSYSWFEIVILGSPGDTTPLKLNEFELAWRSHENDIGNDQETIREGSIFNRNDDDLLRELLKEGNAIGVRVCSRFPGWRNLASEGRLELRFAEPVTEKKPVASQNMSPEAGQAVKWNAKLLDAVDDLSKEAHVVGIEKLAADSLKEPMKLGEDYGLNKHALTILSLDGGGIRGLSSLLILKAIMEHVRGPQEEKLMPYQCFDLMFGTSTGGLIAIMLGRLKMNIDDCISAYTSLAKDVFGTKLAGQLRALAAGSYMYKAEKLKKLVQDVSEQYGPERDREVEMLDKNGGCSVVVSACLRTKINTELAQHFRTYNHLTDKSHKFKIWEAARATTAAPIYFEPINVDGNDYIDGGMQINNPILAAIVEARAAFGQTRKIGCTLSIGTGVPPPMPYAPQKSGWFLKTKSNLENFIHTLLSLATNSELAHLRAKDLSLDEHFAGKYCRFNAKVDYPKEGDPDFQDKLADLDDVASLPKFRQMTLDYLATPEVQEQVKECAEILSRLYREKQNSS